MRLLLVLLTFFFSVAALQAQTVYKTPSGKKYHLATCRMVKNVSEAMDEKTAIEIGLDPCKICKPATVSAQQIISTKAKGEGKGTTQCLGLTKAGSRCKHMTSIANGYYYQHQP